MEVEVVIFWRLSLYIICLFLCFIFSNCGLVVVDIWKWKFYFIYWIFFWLIEYLWLLGFIIFGLCSFNNGWGILLKGNIFGFIGKGIGVRIIFLERYVFNSFLGVWYFCFINFSCFIWYFFGLGFFRLNKMKKLIGLSIRNFIL